MIIGTAGHIDHGKTALVQRLTGIDTDRLPEEKRRGMTIDLGFAYLDLPGVGPVGVVDVPGHERFVRNMVAGATGIDLVLLVVAADDGVMPQTIEHLDIVTLLGIPRGVVALNKTDLVDTARVRAVTDDIRAQLRGTLLADAPIVPVSAHTGEGVEALRAALAQALQAVRARMTGGFFRLPIDRVFTMPGHGTVVTGTVAGGEVHKDDRLRVLPGGQEVRVRGVQVHNQPAEQATAGSRCALNLAGVEKEGLARGMMLVDARLTRASHTADVALTLSRHVGRPPRNHQRVHAHAGTAEVQGRLLWLEERPPAPGETTFAQLRFDEAVPLLYGDRFIVRSGEARHTLGGGIVLDPFAARRGARLPARLERLEHLARFDAEEALSVWLQARGAMGWFVPELAEQLAETPERLTEQLKTRRDILYEAVPARPCAHGTCASSTSESGGVPWVALAAEADALAARLRAAVRDYLSAHPRMTAMPLATLHSTACPRLDAHVFRLVTARLVAGGEVEQVTEGLRPRGHRQQFSAAEEKLAEKIEGLLAARGGTPPKLDALAKLLGQPATRVERFLGELARAGRVVKLASGIYLTRRDLDDWRGHAGRILNAKGRLALGEFRSAIGVGRELALVVLEHFDREGFTRRQGDARIAVAKAQPEARA